MWVAADFILGYCSQVGVAGGGMDFMSWMLVAIGGALGSVLRYALTPLCHALSQRSGFPIGTLSANICGCFLIGLFASQVQKNPQFPEQVRLLLIPGLIGGFTTYSAFAWETWSLATAGPGISAGAIYFAMTSFLAFTALLAGVLLSRLLP